jgi:hypothetical protein
MGKAHWTCFKEVGNLPRKIIKKDKTFKFDKNYSGLFKKNYEEVFGSNLYLEQNISKTASNNEIAQAKQKLFQKYPAKSKRRKAKWGLESNGLVLRIGNRSSSNYYRLYQKQNGLQFELELKNQLVKSFQKLLMDNSIQEFEHNLSKIFIANHLSL